ncbi:MAG: SRPBCC family protein [Solirubrobacteraceae bacterium]|nr:SRPBCC family protein [Solirubrobacteraceae bacterium]
MPVARRTRRLQAPRDEVWATIADAYHLPRWWPNVRRVESVSDDAFTEVLTAGEQGRPVRADFRVVAHEPPRRRVWTQEIEGSPFARVFTAVTVTAQVEADGDGTQVSLAIDQQLRGASRFGAPLVRRSSGRLLDQALDGLEGLHVTS